VSDKLCNNFVHSAYDICRFFHIYIYIYIYIYFLLFLVMHFGVLFIWSSIYVLQNKILHDRLEALHIQLAEKDRNSVGISSGSASADKLPDVGLQNVLNYLRRSKEIVISFAFQLFSLSLSLSHTHTHTCI
jgi:hypothetical protein